MAMRRSDSISVLQEPRRAKRRDTIEPEPLSTVPFALVRAFLSYGESQLTEHLAIQAGISRGILSSPHARITRHQFSQLYRLLASTADDELPGILSRPMRSGTLKFLCLSLLDADRLEVALHRMCQFFHVIVDDFQLDSGRRDSLGFISLRDSQGDRPTPFLGKMLTMKLIHGIASWLIRHPIAPLCTKFDAARPELAEDQFSLFPEPVLFEQRTTSIEFSSELLDAPIRRGRKDLRRFLDRAPEDWIFNSTDDRPASYEVAQFIAGALPSHVTVDQAAKQLLFSERTLSRTLAQEGTSFQSLKDEVRRDLSIRLLTQSKVSIGEVAASVGYDTTAAFHRAFRRWTGCTPGAYRRS